MFSFLCLIYQKFPRRASARNKGFLRARAPLEKQARRAIFICNDPARGAAAGRSKSNEKTAIMLSAAHVNITRGISQTPPLSPYQARQREKPGARGDWREIAKMDGAARRTCLGRTIADPFFSSFLLLAKQRDGIPRRMLHTLRIYRETEGGSVRGYTCICRWIYDIAGNEYVVNFRSLGIL